MNAPSRPLLPAELLATPKVAQAINPALRALTDGLARGDDATWLQFHRNYGPGIFRRLLALASGDHDLAAEALQQTYLRIAKHVRSCEAEPMFAAWLQLVCRSALEDCRRRKRSFRDLLLRRQAEPALPDEDGVAEARRYEALDAALAALDGTERDLLQAKYFDGVSVRALAARLELSEKAVESRLTRARAALRARMTTLLAKSHE